MQQWKHIQQGTLLFQSRFRFSIIGFHVFLSTLLLCPCISGFNGIINGVNLKLAGYNVSANQIN